MADTGRPTKCKKAIVDAILLRMYQGESVNSICKDEDMPARSTVMLWAAEDRDGFSDKYQKAMSGRALYWADEILDIADDSSNDWMERRGREGDEPSFQQNSEAVNRSRLRVDTRKWLLSKLLPVYSDKPPEVKETKEVVTRIEVVTVGNDTDKRD